MLGLLRIGITACLAVGSVASARSADLFIAPNVISEGLEELIDSPSKETVEKIVPVFWDSSLKTPLGPGKEVEIRVEALKPLGAQMGKPAGVAGAAEGMQASFDSVSGKLRLVFKKPNIFPDPEPGRSSQTWLYRVHLKLVLTGSAEGKGGGIRTKGGTNCISTFKIESRRDGRTWPAKRNDGYTYTYAISPPNYADYGEFDADTIYSEKDGHVAFFRWKEGVGDKEISVRWHVVGDQLTKFEDIWTDPQVERNPCARQTIAATPKPTPTPPPAAAPPTGPEPRMPVNEDGKPYTYYFDYRSCLLNNQKTKTRLYLITANQKAWDRISKFQYDFGDYFEDFRYLTWNQPSGSLQEGYPHDVIFRNTLPVKAILFFKDGKNLTISIRVPPSKVPCADEDTERRSSGDDN